MKNMNAFLERLELSLEMGLRYGLMILLILGSLAAISSYASGGLKSYGAFQVILDNVLWAVMVTSLLVVWREFRQLRRRLEGMHLANAGIFEEAMRKLAVRKAGKKKRRP